MARGAFVSAGRMFQIRLVGSSSNPGRPALGAQSLKTTTREVPQKSRSPGCHLCFRLQGYSSEVLTTLSSVSINLLAWLTECGRIFYFPYKEGCFTSDYGFMIKGYSSGTARKKGCTGQSVAKERGALSKHTTLPNVHMCTNPVLWTPAFGVLWGLHYLNKIGSAVGHWRLIQPPAPLSLLKIRGWDSKFQPPNYVVGFPGKQSPSLGAFQMSSH